MEVMLACSIENTPVGSYKAATRRSINRLFRVKILGVVLER